MTKEEVKKYMGCIENAEQFMLCTVDKKGISYFHAECLKPTLGLPMISLATKNYIESLEKNYGISKDKSIEILNRIQKEWWSEK